MLRRRRIPRRPAAGATLTSAGRVPGGVYRSWLALGVSGVLGGVALVALYAGFGAPELFPLAAGAGFGAVLLYRYAADRMLTEVYEGVDGGRTDRRGTTDRETASRATDGGAYDEWQWAGADPDDPFWSTDEDDWEDPWEWERTDPEEAAGESWGRRRRRERERERRWERGREYGSGTGTGAGTTGTDRTTGTGDGRDRTTAAYETLGLEPGADRAAIREAYRERAKETHPDHGGSVEAFLAVREAYEHLRERVGHED